MANPKGRPKVYGGSAVGVRLPALMEIKIRVLAQARGKTFSDVIRETLEPVFGGGDKQEEQG